MLLFGLALSLCYGFHNNNNNVLFTFEFNYLYKIFCYSHSLVNIPPPGIISMIVAKRHMVYSHVLKSYQFSLSSSSPIRPFQNHCLDIIFEVTRIGCWHSGYTHHNVTMNLCLTDKLTATTEFMQIICN